MNQADPYATPESELETTEQALYSPNVFSFQGRIGRLRYLAYGTSIYLLTVLIMASVMGGMAAAGVSSPDTGILAVTIMAVFYLALLIFSIMFAKRRLNDLNRSGWWFILFIIPIINLLLTLYLIFFPGTEGVNRYGPAPAPNSLLIKLFGMILPLIVVLGIIAAIAVPAFQEYVKRAEQAQMMQQ